MKIYPEEGVGSRGVINRSEHGLSSAWKVE
jgi:hypothetical protein